MNKKYCYVLYHGYYNDYHVVGCFLRKKDADATARENGRYKYIRSHELYEDKNNEHYWKKIEKHDLYNKPATEEELYLKRK